MLPSPLDGVGPLAMAPWLALSVGLFVAWHGLTLRLRRGALPITPGDPRVLVQVSLLGLACALAFVVSGSLWSPLLIHWLALVVWRQGLGGVSMPR
ncbi:MAG: type II CAAX prenyl endopeptidase Rce1 family protein [Cyanobium sp.]